MSKQLGYLLIKIKREVLTFIFRLEKQYYQDIQRLAIDFIWNEQLVVIVFLCIVICQ